MNRWLPAAGIVLALAFSACQSTPRADTPTTGLVTDSGQDDTLPSGQPPVLSGDSVEPQSFGARLPRFEPAATCPFTLPATLDPTTVRCGYVTVRENRFKFNNRTIQLAVLVVNNRAGTPNPVANVYLQGGPGGDVQGNILALEGSYLQTFAGQNDLIIFDQRGVGKSIPRLECPTSSDAGARLQATIARVRGKPERPNDPVLEAQIQAGVAAARQCRDALNAKGYDLTAYTTIQNAADVNDIRRALGYKALNLWGGSYGSYLAQIVMRDYRPFIRSVDLEAIIDPRQNWLALAPLAFDRSRLEIFKACANDPACNAAFPNLSQTFDQLVVALNQAKPTIPIPISDTQSVNVQVDGDLFFLLLNQLLYIPDFLPLVPVYINVTARGNLAPFATFLGLLFVNDGTNSSGMYNSVTCSDVVQFTSAERIQRILDRVTPAYRNLLGAFPLTQERVCKEWGVRPDPFATFPVFSDIPTLMQVGFFDPITPPFYAEAVRRRLFKNQFVFYPAGAHGATAPFAAPGSQGACAQGILTAFFANPLEPVNANCAAAPLQFFIPGAQAQSLGGVPFPIPKVEPAPLLPRW
jgi:pimeloyl-ACP methyl ester carboxylesterase